MSALSHRGRAAMLVAQRVTGSTLRVNLRLCSLQDSIPYNRIFQVSSGKESGIHPEVLGRLFSTTQYGSLRPAHSQKAFTLNDSVQRLFHSSTFRFSAKEGENQLLDEKSKDLGQNNEPFQGQNEHGGNTYTPPGRVFKELNPNVQGESGVSRALHNLNLNVQRTGRAYLNQVMAIFNFMQANGECSSNEALLLLRCCGKILTDEKPSARAETSEKLWEYYNDIGVKLDTSHYNALLKNRLDNEAPEFQPSKFLAMMEANGVEPNRVTFQHLIAKFCSLGDIQGATTVLEHMKEQKMSVNENVFHSLIIGHCRADDFPNAKGVMEIMVDSGLDVGSDTRMIYIVELARAGKDFKSELDKAIEEKTQLMDNDYFTLILTLLKKGDKEIAAEIAEMLPKKRGFFQEMRNFIPAMISTGEVELPFKILKEFRTPTQLGNEGHVNSSVADHGLFFLQAMVRNEYDPKGLIEYAKKFEGSEALVSSRILEFCVEAENIPYGQSVYDEIINAFGNDILNPSHLTNFIRAHLNNLKRQGMGEVNASNELIEFWANMGAVGLRPLSSDLSQSLFPVIMKRQQPGKIVRRFHEKMDAFTEAGLRPRSPMPWHQIANAMLQFLLNQENKHDFGQAIGFALHMNMSKRPHLWNSSLARSYLATGSKTTLVTMLGISSSAFNKPSKYNSNNVDNKLDQEREEEHLTRNDVDLFQTLNHIVTLAPRYRPNTKLEDILKPVLEDMLDLKIGMPESVASMLKRNLEGCSDDLITTINQVEELYKNAQSYWTEETITSFLEERKKFNNTRISASRSDYIPMSSSGYIESENMPTDLKGLEKAQRVLEQKGKFNITLTNRLIGMYAKSQQLDDADNRINSFSENGFKLHPVTITEYIKACIESNQFDRAMSFLEKITNLKDQMVWISSYKDLAIAMAKQGEHQKVLDLFETAVVSQLTSSSFTLSFEASDVVNYYADNGDTDNSEKVLKLLEDKGIITSRKSLHLDQSALDLEGDLEAAVEEFERIAKDNKRLPMNFQLLKKLIEKEDTENMQRVLDASVEVIGEERSLYNLAFTFLDTGNLSDAKKLLGTPGLRYNQNRVAWIMQRFSENNKLDELENFVLLSQPIFGCDREFIYSTLVSAFVKADEVNRIQETWVNMQEEDFSPSEKLKLQMANALHAKGYPIPFEVPKQKKLTAIPEDIKIPSSSDKATTKIDSDSTNKTDDDILLTAINENNVIGALKGYKTLRINGQGTIEQGKKVIDLISKIEDKELQCKHLSTIFEDKYLSQFAKKVKFPIRNIINQFEIAQLELITKSVQGNPGLNDTFLFDRRIAQLKIDEDVEGYLKFLEASDDRAFVPPANILRQVIQANPENAERLFNIALRKKKVDPKFVIETIKSCVIEKYSDIAARLWKTVEDQELYRPALGKVMDLSDNDLLSIKEFFISTLDNNASNLETKTIESIKDLLSEVSNVMISNAISKVETEPNGTQRPQDILNEALSKWMPLDR